MVQRVHTSRGRVWRFWRIWCCCSPFDWGRLGDSRAIGGSRRGGCRAGAIRRQKVASASLAGISHVQRERLAISLVCGRARHVGLGSHSAAKRFVLTLQIHDVSLEIKARALAVAHTATVARGGRFRSSHRFNDAEVVVHLWWRLWWRL
jgi:hypothetical protein